MTKRRSQQIPCKYPLPIDARQWDQRVVDRYRASVSRTMDLLEQQSNRPAAIQPFCDLLAKTWRIEQIVEDSRPVVGTVCNFAPEEIILAAGAIPIRLDTGFSAAAEAGERQLAADVCPAVKALMGAHVGQLPSFQATDLMVIPTACDGKKHLVRALGQQRDVWMMQLPQTRDEGRSRALWNEEVQALAKRLQQLTGRRLRRRALKEAIHLLNRRTDLLRRLMELRWSQPGLLSGQDTFVVIQASFLADPAWWVDKTEQLIHELEQRHGADASAEQVRILVTGSPVLFPDLSLLHLIEQHGAVIVADEMCSGTQRLYNPTVVDEPSVSGMLRAAAEKTLLPCTCPCFVSSDRRIDRILDLVRRSRAQGVIHHTLRLCQLYDMEVPRIAAVLKEHGVPLLSIHAEYSTDGSAALKNRVDAFLEMLQQL